MSFALPMYYQLFAANSTVNNTQVRQMLAEEHSFFANYALPEHEQIVRTDRNFRAYDC